MRFRQRKFRNRFCERLRLAAEIGVHCVSEFVRDREDFVRAFLVIEQDIRMATERAHTIRAATFALVFNDVDPSFVERSVKERGVFVAERFQGFFTISHAFS